MVRYSVYWYETSLTRLLGPKSSLYPAQEGIDGVKGAVAVDGVHECVKEVRKQIGAGADWIKVVDRPPIPPINHN